MGSIFKSIKKTIKKVTKPITKVFKGVAKSIAKVGKSVWGGIKELGGKAFAAYGKLSQKLGPIGMIGMSMAMPYLLGGFSGVGGGLWTNFGTGMKSLQASTNPFFKTFGYAGKGLYNAGNFVGGTTRGISQTISKTFQGFAGKGGSVGQGFKNLWQGTSEVLSGKAGMGTMKYIDASMLTKVPGPQAYFKSDFLTGKGVMKAVYNPKTLIQTGGVSLGNVNVANKFAMDSIRQAMAGQIKDLSLNSQKYVRTVANRFGVDDGTAYRYVHNNGVGLDGKLDFSLSPDFKEIGGVGEFNFTGDNLDKTSDLWKIQAKGGYHYKQKTEGDIFETEQSLLGKSKGSKLDKALGATKDWLLGSDDVQNQAISAQDDISKEFANVQYGGTSMAYGTGQLLTPEQKKWFAMMEQKDAMNIAGSR